MKLPKIKKLNAKGVSHHVLIAVLVITGIAGFGAWRVFSSSAATSMTQNGCQSYLGRVWSTSTNTCTKKCNPDAGSPVVASPYDYCSKAASNISKAICDSKKRLFVYDVCLKEWNRRQGAIGYTVACNPHSLRYVVASPYDYCK